MTETQNEEINTSTETQEHPMRNRIDSIIDIQQFPTERNQTAREIAKILVYFCNTSGKPSITDIQEKCQKISIKSANPEEIIFPLIFECLTKMPNQIEIFSALLVHYCYKKENFYQIAINKFLHSLIQDSISNDHYRTLKLLLRATSAFVAHGLIKKESYAALIQKLLDLFKDYSGRNFFCRTEALGRALVVAVLFSINANTISHELFQQVISEIKNYLNIRPPSSVSYLSAFPDYNKTILDLLVESEPIPSIFDEDFLQIQSSSQIDFRSDDLDMTPNPQDLTSFPTILLPLDVNSGSGFRVISQKYNALIADLADDDLVFFGQDPQLCSQQLLSLSLIVKQPSLTQQGSTDSNVIGIQTIFLTVILSDLLRIPQPLRPISYPIGYLFHLIKQRSREVPHVYSPLVVTIMDKISLIDFGIALRFLMFFIAQISSWQFGWIWDKWDSIISASKSSIRRVALSILIREGKYFGRIDSALKKYPNYKEILKEIPEMMPNFEFEQDYSGPAKEILSAMEKNLGEIDNVLKEIASKVEKHTFLKMIAQTVLKFQNPKGEANKAIDLLEQNFNTIIRTYFSDDIDDEEQPVEDPWKAKALIGATHSYFAKIGPAQREMIIHLISNQYVTPESFVMWFFEDLPAENPMIETAETPMEDPSEWILFLLAIEASIEDKTDMEDKAKFLILIFKEAVKMVLDITHSSKEVAKNEKIALPPLVDWFLKGSLREFVRNHCDVFMAALNPILEMGMDMKWLQEEVLEYLNPLVNSQ